PQRRERDLPVIRLRHPARLILRAEVDDGEASSSMGGLNVVSEKSLARGIDPVEVLVQVDTRVAGTLGVDQPPGQIQELELARLGIHARGRALRIRDGEEVKYQREFFREALVEQQKLAGDPLEGG